MSQDGSQRTVKPAGTIFRGKNGKEIKATSAVYRDGSGKISREVHGGTSIQHHHDGSIEVKRGNRGYTERRSREDGRDVMRRERHDHRDFGRDHDFERYEHREHHYYSDHCNYWRSNLWFYHSEYTIGGWGWGFWGSGFVIGGSFGYEPIWGYNYWNNYSWPSYSWYNYYSGWYWNPYGYYAPVYRPSFAVVDWVLASALEAQYSYQIQAAREAAIQANEDAAAAAASLAEAQAILARQQAESDAAAAEASALAQQQAADAQAAASNVPAVGQDVQGQLATQVEAAMAARQAATPVNTAFEAALKDDRFLYLVNDNNEKTYDDGKGGCQIHIGDILEKEVLFDEGLVTMKVKVAQPNSCAAGTVLSMTVPELGMIFNAFQEQVDTGAQILSDKNSGPSSRN